MKFAGAYIEQSKHEKLTKMAKRGERSLSGFLRKIYDSVLSGEITVPDEKPQVTSKPSRKRVA
jgi:hypothetical protein